MNAIPLQLADLPRLTELMSASEAEGYHMVSNLAARLAQCQTAPDPEQALAEFGDFWLLAAPNGALTAIGGLTPDPYAQEARRGRVRHVYVLPDWRRGGLASQLMTSILGAAPARYDLLTLRTNNPAAARLYERFDFIPCDWPAATHYRRLA